ncbi:MAG: Uncharacterized protein G01um10148_655 [Parcubacteria group bacterium Gr01-1014_8]|nr:MAG: Uncharacterized protein G01um10148_655 [Parcubacteria group bacterium Gr01-1014_8]
MSRTIIAIAGLAMSVAIFFFYTKPTYDQTRVLQAQITEYNQALDKAGELQRLKQSLLSRYNAFDPQDIERLHKLLPDHVDNVRLVLDLDNIASRFGLGLQNVVIGTPAEATKTVSGVIGGGNRAFDSLTFKFTTSGSYESFVQFMEELEKSLRIVDLVSLSMNAEGQQTQVNPTYRYDVTVRTYWLK